MAKYLNIKFPFQQSSEGFFVDLTKTTQEQIKSEIALLLTTRKGELRYNPNFGLNMYQFLFQPIDNITKSQIIEEIKDVFKKNMNNIEINNVVFYENPANHQFTGINLQYTINDGVFKQQDSLELIF